MFLLKQRKDPKGIVGWGKVIGVWFRDSDPKRTARAPVLITEILDPRDGHIISDRQLIGILTGDQLNTQNSGRRISSEAEIAIDELWLQQNNVLRRDRPEYFGRNVRSNSLVRIGQAQFAETIKHNYRNRCAICSVAVPEFLVAAHIVRWADDATIRLDPQNGICLCALHDKAFEHGYLLIDDGLRIFFRADVECNIGLQKYLGLNAGMKINMPTVCAPKQEYLERHRNRFCRPLVRHSERAPD